MVAQSAIDSALDFLRPGLASDGFDLRAGEVTDTTVQVILEAKPDACLDCLVPDELMIQMLEDAIRQHDASVARVELRKEGFA
jgi:hypothetical protein